MPLLPGKVNVGHNIEEMEKSGHPHKQAVAAALHTALDTTPVYNEEKKQEAQKAGAIMSHDEPYAKPVTAMTAADVNRNNRAYWGNLGPPVSPEPVSTRMAHVPTYQGAGVGDEVEPTQSNPPDARSNNLLDREDGGIPGTEDEADSSPLTRAIRKEKNPNKFPQTSPERHVVAQSLVKTKKSDRPDVHNYEVGMAKKAPGGDGVVSAARAGARVGENVAEGQIE